MRDEICIKDLLLRGIVGINKEEREKRQDILLNITLFADTSAAGRSDDIGDAVNYRTLTKRVIRMVEASSFFLIERLAAEIVALCLADPRVEAARVRVEKPGALRFARSVGVEIERTREDLASQPNRVFVMLGSNTDPVANLQAAVAQLRAHDAVTVVAVSPVYETAPVGTVDQANFLNAAVLIETLLSASALKSGMLQPIEQALGRVRTEDKNAARTIDLDIALFNHDALDLASRHIPDPDILKHPHVAVPLADVAPYHIHPETGQTLAEIAREQTASYGLHSAGIVRRDDLVLGLLQRENVETLKRLNVTLPRGRIMNVPALRRHLDAHQDEMLASLEDLVSHESPSTDKVHLDALAEVLAQRWRDLGAEVRIVGNAERGNHVRVSVSSTSPKANARPPAVILGHFDTVWPLGTRDRKPFTVDGWRATGPGVYDMKGGLVIAEFAIRAIQDLDLALPRPVVLVLNADEEIGSNTSQALIESEASKAAYVLVLEPAVPGGALKTARKGVGAFAVEVIGLTSHAGSAPQEGVSAVEELARQILRLHSFTDYEVGTTVNVGVIEGGTRSNVVAARAWADVDTRAWTQEEARRIEAVILGLQPFNPKAQIVVNGSFDRMPLERMDGTVALFETARRVGLEMGLDLEEGSSGGGSDGNFTSALGIPTLDGLGVVGDGAHAAHEYIEIASLPERAAIVAGLLCEVETSPPS